MRKYRINWFKYIGLYILYILSQFYLGIQIDFLIRLLIVISMMLLSVERVEK